MTTDVEHKIIKMGDRHGVTNYMFATKADMEAYTNLTELDLEKIARVADTGFGEEGYFILSEINYTLGTRKWVSIFGGAGVGKTNLGLGTITDSTLVVTSDTGDDVTIPAATNTEAGLITGTLRAKLAAQATNAELRDRATHTGSQTASTIGDFAESVQDVVADMLVAGANMALIYNDVTGKLELSSTGGGGGSPAIGARIERTAALSAATSVNLNVPFDTAVNNTYGLYNSSNPTRLTVPTTGWYVIAGSCRWAANNSGGRRIYIFKNGATYIAGSATPSAASMNDVYTSVSVVAYLLAGEYVELQLNQNSGGSLALDVGANVRPAFSIASCGGGGSGVATNLSVANVTATTLDILSDTGTDVTIPASTGSLAGLMTAAQNTKLAGVATGATANSTDATLLDRANHTGTQSSGTISDFVEAVQDTMAATIVAGTNITATYNDTAGTITLDATGGGGGGSTNLSIASITATTLTVVSDTGTDAIIPASTNAAAGLATAAQITKLDGIAAGATVNSSDATLLARTNHTGTQLASTISDFTESVQDVLGSTVSGTGVVSATYDDGAGTLVIASTATVNDTDSNLKSRANHTGTQAASTINDLQETVEDIIGSKIVAGSNVTVTYNDTTGETTVAASGGGGGRVVDINNYYVSTDFLDNSGTQAIWLGTNIGSGSSASIAPTAARTTKHPGTIMVKNGTAVNTGWAFRTQVANSLLTTANMEMNFVFKLAPTIVSGYATNLVLRFGFLDSITATESTDAIGLAKEAGSLNLIGRAVSNGSVTDTSNIYTMVEQTWYQGKIKVGSDGTSCAFSLYDDGGTLLGSQTLTSGLPIGAARLFGSGFVIYHTTLTTSQDMVEMDFMDLYLPNLGRGIA